MDVLNVLSEKVNNGQIEEALELIDQSSSEFFDNAEFWNIKGVLCIKVGEFDTAISCLKRAIEIDSANVDVQYNLAYVYERIGNFAQALVLYKRLQQLDIDADFSDSIVQIIKSLESPEAMKNIIVLNTDSKTAPRPEHNLHLARSKVAEIIIDHDAPLVSIYVVAYNKLEKTKMCLNCILQYTNNVDYELILIDNGSTDDTFEFFKSIDYPAKKIFKVTKNIGVFYASNIALNYARGKYVVAIANDVYVTRNWLSNMLACAMSDYRIGMINPRSSNTSNFQDADIRFQDLEEMQIKAAYHNASDPGKWHERMRLITLGTMYKKECLDMIGTPDYGFSHDFADDDITFRVRRAGYKAILCGDVFVHHDHVVTEKDPEQFIASIQNGRLDFKEKYYGLDAWTDVNNYEGTMMSMIDPEEKRGCQLPRILGIDVLCGTPILELKNKLRAAAIYDAELSAFTSEAKYYMDLKTICTGKISVDRIEYLLEHFEGDKFDYIVLGKPINAYRDPYRLLESLLMLLQNEGSLLIKLSNSFDVKAFLHTVGYTVATSGEIAYQMALEDLNSYLLQKGYYSKNIKVEYQNISENLKIMLKNTIDGLDIVINNNDVLNKIMIKDYIVNIMRQQ